MTRNELENALYAIGVHPNSYSLDGIRHGDCVCVVDDDMYWKVIYFERDRPDEIGVFDNIDSAFDFVYATFVKWLGVKK